MDTLKFEGIAAVGDKIRAYDFEPLPGRPECFIEGIVLEIGDVKPYGYKAFTVALTHDSFGGRPMGTLVYVPLQVGMEYDTRVKNLTPKTLVENLETLRETLINEGYDSPDGEVGLAYHDAADRLLKVLEFARLNGQI